jgi:hypothetical protein
LKALNEINGDLGSVSFDAHDPESISLAIRKMENMVDEKVAGFERNDIVNNLTQQLKDKFRQNILESAAAKRLEED